jgi:preprotein translocase subunit SecE
MGQLALAAWNFLADYPDAVRQVPALIEYTEDERASLTLIIGAVVGLLLVLRYYRRPSVKNWATEVAGELARVTWPTRETVTNGTIVVLVAGAIAALYVAVLDRLWGYLTNLIYGA